MEAMTVEERRAIIDTLRAKRDVHQARDAMEALQADWDWEEDFILYVESQADESAAYIQAVKDELFT